MKIVPLIVGELETNCYLLNEAGELAIIDPGAGPETIEAAIDNEKGTVKYIILTHYHPDHTSAAVRLKARRGGEILLHEAEKDLLDFKADRFLREGDLIRLGSAEIKIIHTPGHTPGGICLLSENTMFTGDTLFLNGYGRTDLEWSSEEDMKKSLERLDTIVTPAMRVFPGHGPMSKISNA